MVQKNLLEKALGIRFAASFHWDPHPVVGLSALCFGVASSAFLAVEVCILRTVEPPYSKGTPLQLFLYPLLALGYAGAVVTCGLADFVFIRRGHRSTYGKVDIYCAAAVFFLSVGDFALRASPAETAVLAGSAIAAFMFSGMSTSFEQWVCRHCFWHAAGGCIGTYGALRLAPEHARIADAVWFFAFVGLGIYAAFASVALVCYFHFVPEGRRNELWNEGAKYAHWKSVVPA
uniref:Uncharacterized protein n=1 Tax=Alexandrium catenella TaxID=2925 RepID=A0A7S1WPX2_ALECA|mmetsp:Transcript_79930/g.212143  ORF Transcript_79930/g.212143 Transcript_79930/m.212143 type:complete len:232 (+) Transcript_79930:56-751(+)|eukprot:CAMPEP_0171207624 /NCGR_PEP_ID=MMETSP0790-20130122/27669_1 /TAXON_ID=2925 /ORGANISM="Alexandrium catenella, Strain OF101" /LENGTH=231 /DNA_ID=CAMNT_0011673195 /DNA_START=37 /DNA_END=732 /DNA_ORIENTATION=+